MINVQKFIDSNDVEVFKKSVKDVNINGFTYLHAAITSNRLNLVEYFLGSVSVDSRTVNGASGLLLACELPVDEKIGRLLIRSGADVNVKDNTDTTPLHAASKSHKLELAQVLVQNGASINCQDLSYYTPLHHAVENDDLEMVDLLLRLGADTGIVECNGWNPLMLSLHDHEKCVEKILPYTSDLNTVAYNGWTALMHAVNSSDKRVVFELIEHGADVNVHVDGLMPVTLAIERDDPELFEYLWDLTDVQVLIDEYELEDFVRCMLYAHWFFPDKTSYLFKVLDTPGVQLYSNRYLQILASNMNDVPDEEFLSVDVHGIVKKLFEKGAQLDDVDLEGFASISYRYKYDYKFELLKILVENNIPFSNWYVIYALVVNDPEFVTILLQFCICIDPLDIFNYITKVGRIDVAMLKLIKYILCLCTPSAKAKSRCIYNLNCHDISDSNVICYALLLDSLECPTKKYVKHVLTPNEQYVFRKLYNEILALLQKDKLPTLKELARDVVRKCLRSNCSSTQDYLACLEKLHLPTYLQDIIQCKTAVCSLK